MNDSECFKWCIVRYLHPADHHPAKNRLIDKIVADALYFEDIKFLVKIEDTHKIEKRILLALLFLVMKIRKKTSNLYIEKVLQRQTC